MKISKHINKIAIALGVIVIVLGALLVQQHVLLSNQSKTPAIVYKETIPPATPTPEKKLPIQITPSTDSTQQSKVDSINKSIEQYLMLQKGDIELRKQALDAYKKCTTEWCYETLKEQIGDLDKSIDEWNEKIEALELQRSILTSGL